MLTTKEMFADNLSRMIFASRLLYAEKRDESAMLDMLEASMLSYPEIDYSSNLTVIDFVRKTREAEKIGEIVNIILFGAGGRSQVAVHQLRLFLSKRQAANIILCDNNPMLWGKEYDCPIPGPKLHIYPSSHINQYVKDKNSYIVITPTSVLMNQIYEQLIHMGFPAERIIKPTNDFLWQLGHQYFEKDILPPPRLGKEVIVDAGVGNLFNSSEFIEWTGNTHKRIIAFEPDPGAFEDCRKVLPVCKWERFELINNALSDENKDLPFASSNIVVRGSTGVDDKGDTIVKGIRLDDFLCGNEVTFIKMDIEGSEMNALRGAENTIRKWKPKLAICVYHKPWDVVEIPNYIKSLVPDYNLFLRHHAFSYNETVLYAI